MKSSARITIAHQDCSFLPKLKSILESPLEVAATDIYEIELVRFLEVIESFDLGLFSHYVLIAVDNVSDDTIGIIRKLRDSVNEPLVILSKELDKHETINCIRAGAIDCIEMQSSRPEDFVQLFDRIKNAKDSPLGQLVSVISCGGGSGGTFVSKSLAQLQCQFMTTCLLDLDFYGGDLSAMLDTDSVRLTNSLLSQGDRVDEEMIEQSVRKIADKLFLLPSEVYPDRKPMCPDNELISRICNYSRENFKLSIVDSSIGCCHLHLAQESDIVVLVTRPAFPYVYRLNRLITELKETGIEESQIKVVVNQVTGNSELSSSEIAKIATLPIAGQIRFDAETANTAINTGLPLAKSKLTLEVKQVAEKIFVNACVLPAKETKKNRVLESIIALTGGLLSMTAK